MESSFAWKKKKKDILGEIYTTALPMDVLLAIAFSFSILQQNLPQSLSNDDLQMFVRWKEDYLNYLA